MSKINREWHEAHRMPSNPTPLERVMWHKAHAENCSCRPIPKGVLPLFEKFGVELPASATKRKEETGR